MCTQRFVLRLATLLLAAFVAVNLGGCPILQPNQNPTASAGADRTVTTGAVVVLSGAGSSDPDGDTLTFSWSQTGGTATVALSGASSATPSFTAPATPDVLTFTLTVSDGRGGTSTDAVVLTVQQVVVPQTPQLYIANFGGNNVVGYDVSNPQNINGNIAPGANLAGATTQISAPTDIVVTATGALLVSNFAGGVNPSITSYANANALANINGNVAPTRNVQGAATTLATPTSVAINTVSDLAFVADAALNRILVYASVSTAAFNGNLAPIRAIATTTSADIQTPFGVNFGASDNLYVANRGGNNVLVFASASTLNGDVTPTRIIQSASFASIFDVLVDQGDRMYVVCGGGGGNRILIFNSASTLNGAVAPAFTLTVTGAANITSIAVDSAGRGYITDIGAQAVYSYDNIATRNGALAPDRTLQGANTQLNIPIRTFLLE